MQAPDGRHETERLPLVAGYCRARIRPDALGPRYSPTQPEHRRWKVPEAVHAVHDAADREAGATTKVAACGIAKP
jgi:hypothetical protein